MLRGPPNFSSTVVTESLNRFRDELAKSIENSLGVQIKPSRNTYHKSYPLHFDFLKAPDNWEIQNFTNRSWSTLVYFLHEWVLFFARMGEVSPLDFGFYI
jgi:hypothetical protein